MVGGINGASSSYTDQVAYKREDAASVNTNEKSVAEATTDAGVVYAKSEPSEKQATYSVNKMSKADREALVDSLKKDQERQQASLAKLVEKIFRKQNKAFQTAWSKDISDADILQAKKDVAEDGYYGVKQTSQRLFDFASALAGDDVDKMKTMQAAIEKGYKQAEKMWGGKLPGICGQTLEATNKLFDDYYKSKEEQKTVEP